MTRRLDRWLKSRPAVVQALAAEFPLDSVFEGPDGQTLYLIGYTEDDTLILSPVDPAVDYDRAKAERTYAHAHHFRKPKP